MTTTNFDIFPLTIHLFNCDMIFLMYALTWSSFETVGRLGTCEVVGQSAEAPTKHVEAIFLNAALCQILQVHNFRETHAEKSSAG